MAAISNSNTKAEILKAYKELAGELKQQQEENTALQRELEKKQKTVVRAAEITQSDAPRGVKALKEQFMRQMDEIEEGLSKEQAKFQDLQAAIALEQKTLEEIYKIKAEAESLDALIITNRKAKEKLEEELQERRDKLSAEIEAAKKAWKREEEEYSYTLQLQRRRDEDEYAEKKAQQEKELSEKRAAFEKEMNEREKAVAARETELQELRKQAEEFEKRLQKSIGETEKNVTERLTREFEYKQKLETKDLEAELRLHQQQIESLRAKIQEQQQLIDNLSHKTDNATQQVKDIAMKAIETASTRQAPAFASERVREEKKGD